MAMTQAPKHLADQSREDPKRGLFLNVLLILGAIGLLTKIWSIVIVMAHLSNGRILDKPQKRMIDVQNLTKRFGDVTAVEGCARKVL